MRAKVRPADEADRERWDAFVAARPEGDPLQTWAWGNANALVGERTVRYLAEREDGSICAVAQALVRAAGFGRTVAYVPHGPVWERDAPDGEAVLEPLVGGMSEGLRRERAIVVKLDPRATPDAPADDVARLLLRLGLRAARHDLQAPTTRLLEIPGGADEAALMAGWDKDARNLARRSRKEGVVTDVIEAPSGDDIRAFHSLLVATAERAKFRLRPLAFFERLFADTGPGRILLVLARWQGRVIGAMALSLVGDRAFYLYGGSLREPELKNTHAAYGAMAAAVEALSSLGIGTLDLWGVVEPDDSSADPAWEGFSAFKRQFGGTPLRHPGTFDLVLDPLWYRLRDARERVRDRIGR